MLVENYINLILLVVVLCGILQRHLILLIWVVIQIPIGVVLFYSMVMLIMKL